MISKVLIPTIAYRNYSPYLLACTPYNYQSLGDIGYKGLSLVRYIYGY